MNESKGPIEKEMLGQWVGFKKATDEFISGWRPSDAQEADLLNNRTNEI